MTTEIAVMNKEAIAMAADSAVTFSPEAGQKIFTSADKIFTLSKYHPVGIMVYGSAQFMGIPWETIIKKYRSHLGAKSFNSLKEYVDNFILYLNGNGKLFPEQEQLKYLEAKIGGYFFYSIKKDILTDINNILKIKKRILKNEVKDITSRVIKRHHNELSKCDYLECGDQKEFIAELKDKYSSLIDKLIKNVFEKLPVSQKPLKEIAIFLLTKNNFHRMLPTSGLVIAGFGNEEIFPSMFSCFMECVAASRIICFVDSGSSVGFSTGSLIRPFAQDDMVVTFIEGVAPDYDQHIRTSIAELFRDMPVAIIDSMHQLSEDEKAELKKKYIEKTKILTEKYIQMLDEYRKEHYVNPVMKVVAALPKEELAVMAETLVNLTSYKRKVSMDKETVGGPVDVALISKGDGLVWIKRKHYFDSKINSQFFLNYYREEQNETRDC